MLQGYVGVLLDTSIGMMVNFRVVFIYLQFDLGDFHQQYGFRTGASCYPTAPDHGTCEHVVRLLWFCSLICSNKLDCLVV